MFSFPPSTAVEPHGDDRRVGHEQFLDAPLPGDGHLGGGEQVGEHDAEARVEVPQHTADLGGGLGGDREEAAQVGVGPLEGAGQFLRAPGEAADGRALLRLGAQHGLAVVDEQDGGRQGTVGGLDEVAAAVEEHLEVVAVSFEGLPQLVDDRAQIVLRHRPHQVVHTGEDVGDGGGYLGVRLVDAGAVRQVGEPSLSGRRSMYCSPTAESAATTALVSAGMRGPTS